MWMCVPSASGMSEIAACPPVSYCWWFFSSSISHLLSLLQAVTLLACSLDAKPLYASCCTFQDAVVVVQLLSCVCLFVTLWTIVARLLCPSPSPEVGSNSCSLSQWCHPTISSSVISFSSFSQSSPASGSFQMSQLFTPGGQSIRASV